VSSLTPSVTHGILKFARTVRVYFFMGVYTAISPIGYLLLAILSRVGKADPVARARRMQRVTTTAYRFMHRWLHWVRIAHFDYRGVLPGLPAGPCVVVANHPTIMDISAITALLGGGCTVAKPSLYRRRMLHRLLEASGTIEGPGPDPVAAGRVVDSAVRWIQQGFSLILFPEGTRSPPGRLLPFGRAAFEIACRARVPVVSLAIRCVPMWLSKEVPLFQPPHPMPHLRLTLLATDDPAAVQFDSHRLRELVEGRYRSWYLLGLPSGTPGDGADVMEPATAAKEGVGRWRNRSKIA